MGEKLNLLKSNNIRIKNILLYLLGVFALKGVSFLLTPLYTRVFSTAEYGVIELGNSVLSFTGTIIGFGLCQYLGIEYFHFKEKERTIAIEKNIIQYLMAATPVIVILFIFCGFNLITIVGLENKILFLVFGQAYLAYFSNLCLMLCKNQQKTNLMTGLQLIIGIVTLFINVLGVVYLGWGIYSIFITGIISGTIFAIAVPFVYKLDIRLDEVRFTLGEFKHTLSISIPLAITGLVNSVLLLSDRWILNYYCSESEIGIYSLATKFCSVFEIIVVNTLTIFYSPHIYKSYQNEGIKLSETKNRKNLNIYLIVGIISILGFVLLLKIIFPFLIGEKFAESEKYVWLILIGEVFLGAMYFRTYLINYLKETKSILFINFIAMIYNIVANIILIPKFKIWAAAFTTTTSYILMFIIATFINKKKFIQVKDD